MNSQDRQELADTVRSLGEHVNELRLKLIEQRAPFIGGVVRAAEESLLLAHTVLSDSGVDDSEL